MRIKINCLSRSSIQKAIDELQAYEKELNAKCETFVQRLISVGIPVVEEKIALAQKEVVGTTKDGKYNIEKGSDTEHTITSTFTRTSYGAKATLIAEGKEILFIEYGAGVYYNGEVGSSPHPNGESLGYTIGTYGEGHGAQSTWGYRGSDGEIHLTHGTPATMPMHFAKNKIISDYVKIASEVFG